MDWKLYIHTNKTNGKKYIGITSESDVNRRWKNGHGYKNQVFGQAIRKYGWDGFAHEVVAIGTEEQIKNLEKKLIKKFRAQERAFGYNVKSGGEGGKLTREHKEMLREKLRQSNGKRVYQYELWGEMKKIFKSITEVKDSHYDVDKVKKCCESGNRLGYYYGYRWSYRDMTPEEVCSYPLEEPVCGLISKEMEEFDEWLDEICEKNML